MCIGYCMLGIESTTMHQELWDKPFELIKETKTIYLYLFVVFYTVFSYTTSRMHQVGGNRTRGEDKVTSIHRLLIKKNPRYGPGRSQHVLSLNGTATPLVTGSWNIVGSCLARYPHPATEII